MDISATDAWKRLHALGTEEALRRLEGEDADVAAARAFLRDTRWAVAEAGAVPIVGAPSALRVATEVIRLRLRDVGDRLTGRAGAAALGGGVAGALSGALGGLLLRFAPRSEAHV